MKVYLVEMGWHYEGSYVVHVASSEEKAYEWLYKHYEQVPCEPVYRRQQSFRWKNKVVGNTFDVVEIKEMELDGE